MVKLTAKKLLALALSTLMLTGTVTDWLPAALAAEGPEDAVTQQASPSDPKAADPGAPAALAAEEPPARQLDFQDPDNGRPNLYVDFLGDNIGNGTAIDRGHLVAPAAYNKDHRTNPIDENSWQGYTADMVTAAGADNIIFWVGVGVDRTQVWELLKNSGNKGITSLELGFYYNKKYIEPYVGADGYAATIERANIANGSYANQWSDAYQLLHAETDLPVEDGAILRADPITQDEMANPSLDNIRDGRYSDTDAATDAEWRMTYISLELKDLEDLNRRLAGRYEGYETDADGDPVVPPAASGTDDPPEYLMMIPFVVHRHDAYSRLCLRLIRDASHFSIGAGNDGIGDGGEGSYAAWERVTTRNEGKDLKLQLRFAGDLNIWSGDPPRVPDVFHEATLLIRNGGGSQNTARLSVQQDLGATPVYVDQNNQTISKLQGGTGMQLDLTVQSGYTATVWVYYNSSTENNASGEPIQMGWPFVTVTDQEKYTFVMPNEDVYVLVVFQPGNTRDYTLYLSEDPKPYATGYMLGNETVISSFCDQSSLDLNPPVPDLQPVSITSFDPRGSHPNDGHGAGPKMTVTNTQTVTVKIDLHPDYEARVHIYNFASQQNIDNLLSAPSDMERDATDNTIMILPSGGTFTFAMPQSDVDVVVEYTKVVTKTAKLEVWHVDDAAQADKVKDINIAQLAYLSYDEKAAASTAYSGQVYEKVDAAAPDDLSKRDHSAVKDPSYKTAWVPYSAATISGSLGGDTGRTGRVWSANDATGSTALMATLANATSAANLAGRFNALDLLGADLLGDGGYMGLRKNLDGELYGDSELTEVADLLWELRSKIMADPALQTLYYLDGHQDATTTYKYFDLTPAQVQAYRIDCLVADATYQANRQAYRKAYQSYQEAKLIYDQAVKNPITATATAPILPQEPLVTQVDDATGLREYQGAEYESDYLADYAAYMTAYTTYISGLLDTPSPDPFTPTPKARPGYVSVPLRTADDAKTAVQNAITKYKWNNKEVKDPTAQVETAATVSTRSGRTVWLLVEADSAYEVASVQLLDTNGIELKDPGTGMTLEARASASFKNVYTFSMPREDCIIRVNYKLRSQRTLQWHVVGAGGKEKNVAHIEAYQVTTYTAGDTIPTTDPSWDNVYPANVRQDPAVPTSPVVTPGVTRPTLAKRTNAGHVNETPYPDTLGKANFPVEGLLVKSQVTVRLTCDDDYRVTVTATNGSGGTPIQVTSNAAAGLYTFTVPEGTNPNVVLTITYAPKSQARHEAHIRLINYDGTPSAGNTGLWDNGSADIGALSGAALHGNISLEPGYYIYTSYAVGEHGTYPYTLDGSGYNNNTGAGAVSQDGKRSTVKLEATMPDEDLYVYLVIRKGLPPEEPGNALTVVVLDEDNTGTTPADNWARATVYAREDGSPRVALPAAGKGATGGGKLQVTHYGAVEYGDAIMVGDRVELDLSAVHDQHYYVAEVGLEPSYLGGDLEWLPTAINSGARKLQFTMPAGSATVTVRFRKLEEATELAPSYYIHAQKIETGRDGNTTTNPNNRITTAISQTIQGYTGAGNPYNLSGADNPEQVPGSGSGRGAGVAGEKVTMTFQVDAGWYVQSVAVMTDGSARPVDYQITSGDNNGGGGAFTADLVMPAGDAWFIVKYRQCPEDPENPGGFLPRPELPEYAITLMVIDNDNTGDPPDPNTVTASFSGAEGVHHDAIRAGKYFSTTAIQYIHAGDRVELKHDLAPGYSMDYIIVNPTEQGIVPTYVDPTTSQFTMPARNITVIAKIVKRAQQPYTADLILRPPAGMSLDDLATVGWGTFTNNGGSLTDYDDHAVYSLLLNPGEPVNFDLYALDGYYIRVVTVEPAVGASSSLTGSFGRQSGGFVMPAANVYVNVFFERGWPDEVKYDLTLKVHDSSSKDGNYAHFATAGGVDFPAADRRQVHGGESYTVAGAVLDGQEVQVTLNRETGYYYDRSTIRITDSSGADIPWRFTATGLAFRMPPRSTTVEVSFRKDDRTEAENPARQAVLHIDGAVKGSEIVRLYRNDGSMAGDFAFANGQAISGLHAGDLLHLLIDIPAASRTTRRVAAAYGVDRATGEQLILPITQVPAGGLVDFAVPILPGGVDATKPMDIYVALEDKDEGDLDLSMTLVAHGPSGSGTATMLETDRPANTVTATAGATPPNVAVGAIHAAQGSQLTVTMTPAVGYVLSQLTVTDHQGNRVSYDWISMLENDDVDPSVWYPNPQQQITLAVPATGGTVEVTYAPIPTDPTDPSKPVQYRAQVVVNDSEYNGTDPSRNNATLSVGTQLQQKLVTARPGEWIDLDITVQAGYRVLPIFVSPQTFGISPQLYLGDLDSQTTGFVMPAGDVTVYVTFVRDNLPVYNATLVVKGYRGAAIDAATDLGTNQATIHSDRTGTRGPIDSSDDPVSVQAAANREWVTVVYDWEPNDSWVSSVTVLDRAGRKVPFTQVDEHTITLPMVARDIVITVTYEDKTVTPPPTPVDPPDDPTPELTPVRLHVIDMTADHSIDTEAEGWGQVTYTPDGTPGSGVAQDSGRVTALPVTDGATYGLTDADWGNTKMIWVPAGRDVVLNAFSNYNQGIYILSAYVLYRDGGQMIECNFKPNNQAADPNHSPNTDPGFYWDRTATFQAHPDYNDVYVFLTKEKPAVNEFSATLMLKGPAEDTASAAAIWTGTDLETNFTQKATVQVNGDHGRITAKRKEKVTVTVTPAEGYTIDYILVTPLGVPVTPKKLGNTYTFSMPGYNVSICVYLKRSNEQEFNVKVHYAQQWDSANDLPGDNRAKVSWSPDGTATDSRTATRLVPDSTEMTVTENAVVTLDVTLDDPYVVLAAYALTGGSIVPLSPALEGTKETVSLTDNTLADGTATFTMPNGDVDVYVVTTNDPPTGVWHTAVLTVQDPDDSGQSTASISRDNTATGLPSPGSKTVDSAPVNHDFITVRQGQTVNIVVNEDAASPYTFDRPAILTHAGSYTGALHPISSSPTQYVYAFTVGNCNSAVLANFKKKSETNNPLTVVIEDPDNPGDGFVRQTATVTAGALSPLTLASVNPVGAYQVIHNVGEGDTVALRAEAHPGYQAYAYWSYGTVRARIPLTQTGDAINGFVYTGSVTMPAQAAQITITYYRTYTATITIHDRNLTDQSSQAQLRAEAPAEIAFPAGTAVYEQVGQVAVSQSTQQKATISDLDTGARLTTTVTPAEGSVVTAVLATDATGTHFLSPNGVQAYLWQVDKSNVDIVVMIDAKTEDPSQAGYIASVVTQGKPASASAPTLAVAPLPNPDRHGSIWSSANAGAAVTVTAPPVAGYRIEVTGRNMTDGSAVAVTAGAGNTYTATMPAANLELTVTYIKEPTLTLRVVEPASTTTLTPRNATQVTGTGVNLTADGQTTLATAGDTITVTATPSTQTMTVTDVNGASHNCPVVVKEIALHTPTGTTVLYVNTTGDTNPITRTFTMPDGDATVVVRYGLDLDGIVPGPDTPDDDEDYYTAWVETKNDDGWPENRVVAIWNATRPNVYPAWSPDWACGAEGNGMKLSISVKAGYYVTVTAETRNPDGNHKADVPVIQMGSTGIVTASATMPGEDLFFIVTYGKEEDQPDPETTEVTLVLVGHGGLIGNAATLTGGSLADLSANGQTGNHILPGDPTSRVYEIKGTAKVGDELRLSANWAGGYEILRATVSLPKTAGAAPNFNDPLLPDGGDYTATTLDLSRYGTNATARLKLPGKGAVVTVYYGNIYEATLHIVPHGADGRDVNGNTTSAADSRTPTVTSTGGTSINKEGDKLIELAGGETVQTTAIPDTTMPNNQRLVGVVWESATLGASAATANGTIANRYDFTMPAENVDFYAVYETEPADPKDRSYIAKVRFADDSAHLGSGQNAVTITNATDASAAAGRYWTAAKAGENIVVNVKVADGYKAEIITTHEDKETGHTGEHFDFYTTRTSFVPNLTLGKDASFLMPAETDATVTVRYTKGYDLFLEVADTSGLASTASKNIANVTTGETPARTLRGESAAADGKTITYAPDPAKLSAVDGGVNIETAVTAAVNGGRTAQYKVTRSSPFTGTVLVNTPGATHPYSYPMPSADTVETVVFYNDLTPLLAKVELKGESDINGNTATPIVDRTDTVNTVQGTVWTTTAGDHTIDLTLTVAKGYLAKIKVRRDNDNYYNNPGDATKWDFLDAEDYAFTHVYTNADGEQTVDMTSTRKVTEVQIGYQEGVLPPSAFPDDISGPQHFRFTMAKSETDPDGVAWTATDVTVIVEFVFAGTIPQPFDPDNMKMDKIDLDRGFIYGENRGDFALIDIPTLYQDTNKELFDTDNYDKGTNPDPGKNTKFQFFLYDAAKDEYTPLAVGTDILLAPEDEDALRTAGDPYNYYDYKTTLANGSDILDDNPAGTNAEKTYTGARFQLIPTEPDAMTGKRTAGAEALYKMLNNDGSLEQYTKEGADAWRTKLYVIAEDAIGQKSAYTQVWIRPHFTLAAGVISYAPTHETTANLYKLMSQDELDAKTTAAGKPSETRDAMNFQHYRWDADQKPYLSNYAVADDPVVGANKWYQQVTLMSSELLGGYATDYDPGATTLLSNVVKADADNGDFTYALTLEKAADLTYTRVKLDLSPYLTDFNLTTPTFPSYYDDNTLTYTISDIVYLITGDADGDQVTGWQDYDLVYTYVWRNMPWNNTQREEPEATDPNYTAKLADWWLSTYNPDSMAYWCDLDGDRALTIADVNIVQTRFDYNRTVRDYLWTVKDGPDAGKKVLPFGFGGEKGKYATLFAVDAWEEGPVDADPYWDELVDPEAEGAPPLWTIYVDEAGFLWIDWEERLEEAPGHYDGFTGRPADPMNDETLEVPEGEEAMDWPVYLPGQDERVELPDLGLDAALPEPFPVWDEETDHDDNGPDGTSADITNEE